MILGGVETLKSPKQQAGKENQICLNVAQRIIKYTADPLRENYLFFSSFIRPLHQSKTWDKTIHAKMNFHMKDFATGPTSFPGSLLFPRPEGREKERPWERGCNWRRFRNGLFFSKDASHL